MGGGREGRGGEGGRGGGDKNGVSYSYRESEKGCAREQGELKIAAEQARHWQGSRGCVREQEIGQGGDFTSLAAQVLARSSRGATTWQSLRRTRHNRDTRVLPAAPRQEGKRRQGAVGAGGAGPARVSGVQCTVIVHRGRVRGEQTFVWDVVRKNDLLYGTEEIFNCFRRVRTSGV